MGTDVHAVWQAKKNGEWVDVPSKWKQDRHYLLFSWLANVRNGFGFAGIPTYDAIKPIALPRGIPEDFECVDGDHPASLESVDDHRREWMLRYKEEYLLPDGRYRVWIGDHSYSWLTADEILKAQRPGPVNRTGVIPIQEYRKWDGKTPLERWSGGISGPGIVVASMPSRITSKTTHVQVEWEAPDGLDYFVDEVRRMKQEHGEVRLVFGFDS